MYSVNYITKSLLSGKAKQIYEFLFNQIFVKII